MYVLIIVTIQIENKLKNWLNTSTVMSVVCRDRVRVPPGRNYLS